MRVNHSRFVVILPTNIIVTGGDNGKGFTACSQRSQKMKAKGGHTMAEIDGEGRNNKKQSGNRHKCGNDK